MGNASAGRPVGSGCPGHRTRYAVACHRHHGGACRLRLVKCYAGCGLAEVRPPLPFGGGAMAIATINGLEIHYREKGEGFPVVLVHGFTGNSRNWALTVPVLTRTFRTISIDLRGHGHSAKLVRALALVDTAAEIPADMVNEERRAERERLAEIARDQGVEAVFEEQLR